MATAPILKLPVEILRQILHAVVLANVGHSFDFYKNFEIFESHCIELSRVCSKFRAVLSPTAVLSQSLTQDINDAKWFLDPNSRQTGTSCLQHPHERAMLTRFSDRSAGAF